MEPTVESSNTTYEDHVAETILLSQRLPVGSYWKDDKFVYKINQIVLGDGIASAACTKITTKSRDPLYSYGIFESSAFVHDIDKLTEIDFDEYDKAQNQIVSMIWDKNNELFQKQCLLKMPTETPFEDFDTLHDEIIELDGYQYFFYEPLLNNMTCFRLMRVDMNTYDGASTEYDGWHFFMNDRELLGIGPKSSHNNFGDVINRHRIFPITEFQFKHLSEFIENKP